MIGGTTWVSTADYYKLINKEVNRLSGGQHSARLILNSLDFQEIVDFQEKKNFDGIKALLVAASTSLLSAGVAGIMLCANTMHKYAEFVIEATGLPLVHIVDATAAEIADRGYTTVGLLGTNTTMQEPFYRERLQQHGITAIVPGEADRDRMHRIIFDELANDIFMDNTRQKILRMMEDLHHQGAQGIILGCTEIPLIIRQEHTSIPVFDTLLIHANAGARFIVTS